MLSLPSSEQPLRASEVLTPRRFPKRSGQVEAFRCRYSDRRYPVRQLGETFSLHPTFVGFLVLKLTIHFKSEPKTGRQETLDLHPTPYQPRIS